MKQLLIILILSYAALVFFMYFQQRKFVFFPTRAHHDPPSQGTEFSLERDGVILRGWMIQGKYADDRLIIYYGGNAEDIYYAADQFLHFGDTAALLVNYRGYGASTGTPGQQELFADALAIFDEMKKRYNNARIFLMGRSLGSGVASYVASQRTVAGTILITPFDSIATIAKRQYFFLPINLLLKHPFRSTEYAPHFTAPTLMLYGGDDKTVLPQQTQRLAEYINGEKHLVRIEGAEHNNIEMFDRYNLEILKFIQ